MSMTPVAISGFNTTATPTSCATGHMHHPHDDHVDEHVLPVSGQNPDICTPTHTCEGHEASHIHGPDCGHEAVPHGDHTDFFLNGHLHFAHDTHWDDHGLVT